MKYKANVSGSPLEIEFKKTDSGTIEASIGDRTYTLQAIPVEPGVYWFNHGDQSIQVTITPSSDGYTAAVGSKHFPIEILDGRSALRKAGQGGHDGVIEIRAPMPGKVVKVLAAEGSEIRANQGILVMEAMKMQNEIKSPKNGTVLKLGVSEGQAVNSGDVLVTIE